MHQAKIDRTNPGCIVALLDQSASMREPIHDGGGRSKAEVLAAAVDSLLYDLVIRCIKNPAEGPRHYYDVAVLGYGGEAVGSALGGALAGRDLVSVVELANHPLRVDVVAPTGTACGRGGDVEAAPRTVRRPVWVEPAAAGGTPMGAALDRCGAMLATWVRQHPTSFPPVVINVSDGAATDGDPTVWSDRLRTLSTADGPVLVFNLNLTALPNPPVLYPSSSAALGSDYARTLFQMSSPLPPQMARTAADQGLPIADGARGFVLNADVSAVVQFLQIGTATVHAMV